MNKQGFSTILPGYEYIPDIEPKVFDGRVYLYGSHDKFGANKFCANDYVLYSADVNDLTSWKFEGEIYNRTQDPVNTDGKYELWAPDVAKGIDGRYYLYYCLADYPQIGVAVSDTPNGKFEFLSYVKDEEGQIVGSRSGDTLTFDPAVLVDDDNRVWLYYGNGPMGNFMRDKKKQKASCVVELKNDMCTIIKSPKQLIPTQHNSKGTSFEGNEFFEASSIRKFNDKYYFIYSSVKCHELCYGISNKPDRDFTYMGVLVSNGDIVPEDNVEIGFNGKESTKIYNYLGNNHGSVICINGQYYIFFHRHTNRNMFSRQVCVEKINMLPNGQFEQARLTSCGTNNGPLCAKGVFEARTACHLFSKKGALFSTHPMVQNKKHPALTQDGQDRENNSNQHIENMKNGATAGFRYFEFENVKNIAVTTRGKAKGNFVVKNGLNGETVAIIPILPSENWAQFTSDISIKNTVGSLYFTYEGKGAVDFLSFEIN